MPDSDPAAKYHAAITLLAESAERDKAQPLATVLETVASAIALGTVPELAELCVKFWAQRAEDRQARSRK